MKDRIKQILIRILILSLLTGLPVCVPARGEENPDGGMASQTEQGGVQEETPRRVEEILRDENGNPVLGPNGETVILVTEIVEEEEGTVEADSGAGDTQEAEPVETVSQETVPEETAALEEEGTVPEKTVAEVPAGDVHSGLAEVSTAAPDVMSVSMPVETEGSSVLDFILDPLGLIHATGAVKYGGKHFEEGANLFFRNEPKEEGGDVSYSSQSDFLSIQNKGTVSVNVSLTVTVEGLQRVGLSVSDDFAGSSAPAVYLALVDGSGEVIPIPEEGELSVSVNLEPASKHADLYDYNEDSEVYELVNSEEESYDEYRFALRGACNPEGDWTRVRDQLTVNAAWIITPLFCNEDEGASVSENEAGESGEEPVSGNEAQPVSENTAEPVPGNEVISGNEAVSGEETVSGNGAGNTVSDPGISEYETSNADSDAVPEEEEYNRVSPNTIYNVVTENTENNEERNEDVEQSVEEVNIIETVVMPVSQ